MHKYAVRTLAGCAVAACALSAAACGPRTPSSAAASSAVSSAASNAQVQADVSEIGSHMLSCLHMHGNGMTHADRVAALHCAMGPAGWDTRTINYAIATFKLRDVTSRTARHTWETQVVRYGIAQQGSAK